MYGTQELKSDITHHFCRPREQEESKMKLESNKLDKYISMQKEFAREYRSPLVGLVSIDIAGVHLTNEAFFSTFDVSTMTDREDSRFPYEYHVVRDGVKFFCLTRELHENQ